MLSVVCVLFKPGRGGGGGGAEVQFRTGVFPVFETLSW